MGDVVPMLSYEDCLAMSEWLARAFGFEEVERFGDSHVTMRSGDGLVFVGKPGDAYVNPLRARSESEALARMYEVPWVVDGVCVTVDDVESLRVSADAAGARILSQGDLDGRTLYRIEDPEGHRWMFVQR